MTKKVLKDKKRVQTIRDGQDGQESKLKYSLKLHKETDGNDPKLREFYSFELPKELIEELQWIEGDQLEIHVVDNKYLLVELKPFAVLY